MGGYFNFKYDDLQAEIIPIEPVRVISERKYDNLK